MKTQFCFFLLLISLILYLPAAAQGNKTAITNEVIAKIQSTIHDDEVTIEWDTEREKNIHCFIMERSFDGDDFMMIAMVPAKNRYTVGSHYQVTDSETLLQPGMVVYYRLKTVDMNGVHRITVMVVEKNDDGLISCR